MQGLRRAYMELWNIQSLALIEIVRLITILLFFLNIAFILISFLGNTIVHYSFFTSGKSFVVFTFKRE